MPATKTSIWKREIGPVGPVKTSVFWAVMGALIGFGVAYKDATWPIEAITLAILFAGMGASFGQTQVRRNASPQICTSSVCFGCQAVFLVSFAVVFVAILCFWDMKIAVFAGAIFGGVCGLSICLIGYWILLRELRSFLRTKTKSTNPSDRESPAD